MPEPSPTELQTEELTSILDSSTKIYSPSVYTPSVPYITPYDMSTEELTSLLVYEPNINSASGDLSILPYMFPSDIPIVDPISVTPYTPIQSSHVTVLGDNVFYIFVTKP